MAVKVASPDASPRQGLVSYPKDPWTCCHGRPHPPPFPPCHVAARCPNDSVFRAVCLPQGPGKGGAHR